MHNGIFFSTVKNKGEKERKKDKEEEVEEEKGEEGKWRRGSR